MNALIGILGLMLLSVGVGLFDYRLGLCVYGAGLLLDAMIPRAK